MIFRSRRLVSLFPHLQIRTFAELEDIVPERTTISNLNILSKVDAPVIERININGFNIRQKWYLGSIVILSNNIFSWKVPSFRYLSYSNLVLFHLIQPKLELLIIGTGSKVEMVDKDITKCLRDSGVAVEIQDTRHAASTFNYMLDEFRSVAAALIPPRKVNLI